MEKIRLSFS